MKTLIGFLGLILAGCADIGELAGGYDPNNWRIEQMRNRQLQDQADWNQMETNQNLQRIQAGYLPIP